MSYEKWLVLIFPQKKKEVYCFSAFWLTSTSRINGHRARLPSSTLMLGQPYKYFEQI